MLTTANLLAWLSGNRPAGPGDIVLLAAITSVPLLPLAGFHVNQARRQFRAGQTLADLRAALQIARRERTEADALAHEIDETRTHRVLRIATVGSATWLAVTAWLVLKGVIHEHQGGALWIFSPVLSTMLLGAVSNALDISFTPIGIRTRWQTGIRERLWNSRAGEWLARRLGAPERSHAVGGGVFRATEAVLAARVPSATLDAELLETRRRASSSQLAESIAALEGIRLDLLRLHADASDLAPLTTLMDAARRLGDDMGRLAEAQREVEAAVGRRVGTGRIRTS